jgi:predicted DNA binding CopG/RHH family protein
MSKQIQSYISEEDYNELKKIAKSQGLLFATLIRQIIVNYLKTVKNDRC